MTARGQRGAPIGVFDSGVGGLTVVARILADLAAERVHFIGDQAHVPYGDRPLDEVSGFARCISEALLAAGCKAVVMACNISSATALLRVQMDHPGVPIVGVLKSGAAAAIATTRSGRIAILATVGTVRSGAYGHAIQSASPHSEVVEVPCPTLVPLVESGAVESPEAVAEVTRCLQPARDFGADTVVLGCTHYPLLRAAFRAAAPDLAIIDPADGAVAELGAILRRAQVAAIPDGRGPDHLLMTTGDLARFECQITKYLPAAARVAVRAAAWRGDRLDLEPAFQRAPL